MKKQSSATNHAPGRPGPAVIVRLDDAILMEDGDALQP